MEGSDMISPPDKSLLSDYNMSVREKSRTTGREISEMPP